METLQDQIDAARKHLMDLAEQADAQGVTPTSKVAPRISIGVTPEEFREFQALARRCNSSISALGQLAVKHLLIQARNGAVPMLPPSVTWNAAENKSSVELSDAGRLVSIEAWSDESTDELQQLEGQIHESTAQLELTRLARLTDSTSNLDH